MAKPVADLDAMVLDLIAHDPGPGDNRFNDVALALFTHQFQRNEVYQAYCRRREADPTSVQRWQQIPAVPTAAFKETPITAFPVDRAVRVFKTSGTTGSAPGKHYLDALTLYEAAVGSNFAEHLLPTGARLPMMILAPSPDEKPSSSLSHMFGVVAEQFAPRYSYYIRGTELLADALAGDIEENVRNEQPVCLLGTTMAFVHWFEACQNQEREWQLPEGSRAMDTGGSKGLDREIPRDELLELFELVLGIPATHVVNEYGMAEMGSQFYDVSLKCVLEGRDVVPGKHVPHWVRTAVVDPETLEELPAGETGLLKHVDLVNRGSVIALQTEDLGHTTEAGIEIVGRAPEAEARGCSLALDQLLQGSSGDG